jgi:hypothetical protein
VFARPTAQNTTGVADVQRPETRAAARLTRYNGQLDRHTLTNRLRDTTGTLRADEHLRQAASDNWYILFGEPLPA